MSSSLYCIVCRYLPFACCACPSVSSYDSPGWNSKAWCDSFDTVKGEWIDVDIPFDTLK